MAATAIHGQLARLLLPPLSLAFKGRGWVPAAFFFPLPSPSPIPTFVCVPPPGGSRRRAIAGRPGASSPVKHFLGASSSSFVACAVCTRTRCPGASPSSKNRAVTEAVRRRPPLVIDLPRRCLPIIVFFMRSTIARWRTPIPFYFRAFHAVRAAPRSPELAVRHRPWRPLYVTRATAL
jgi:hypothetical protein